MSHGANISIVKNVEGQPLTIRDEGSHDKYKTVTNDVENVVTMLRAGGYLPEGRRLFYYDSEGTKDEILIEGGQFKAFKPGGV